MAILLSPFFLLLLGTRLIFTCIELSLFLLPLPRFFWKMSVSLVFGAVIGSSIWAGWYLTSSIRLLEQQFQETKQLEAEQEYWQSILDLQQNNRDVLLNRAYTACDLGDRETCELYLQKARDVDPGLSISK